MQAMGIVPILESPERELYHSLTELVRSSHGGSSHDKHVSGSTNAAEFERFLVDLRDKAPGTVVDEASGLTAAEAIKTFRSPNGAETIFVRKAMDPYLDYNYSAEFPASEKEHWGDRHGHMQAY